MAIGLLLRLGRRVDRGGFLQVHARAEGRTRPRQHDGSDLLIHTQLVDGIAELGQQRPRKGVALLGAIEGENRDRASIFADDESRAHGWETS